MEYASFLAGEPFSDQPGCTHPLLAELARMVNDSVSDAGRQRLLPLVPAVIGRTSDDPRVAALLVQRLVDEAEARGVEGPSLRWHRRRAQLRLRRIAGRGPAGPLLARLREAVDFAYREGPASRAVNAIGFAASGPPDSRRDDRLTALLVAGIDVLERVGAGGSRPDAAATVRRTGTRGAAA